jgi:hypothetical protein
MEAKKSIREQIANYDAGLYDAKDVKTQIQAGWYDWFCRKGSLYNKTRALYPFLKKIAKSPKINQDNMCFFFKNNCPVNGSLYDSISICDIETGDVVYWVTPSLGYNGEDKGKAEVDRISNCDLEVLAKGRKKDVINWFMEV